MPTNHRMPINTIHINNAALLPEVIRCINSGHTVTLPLRGISMRPFLEDGRDKALLTSPERVAVGDVVLAETTPAHYVLHRIVKIDNGKVTLLGDGNLTAEHCDISDLKAKATGFYRKGRATADYTNDMKWHVYSWWWTRLLPIRRYLLWIYRKCYQH